MIIDNRVYFIHIPRTGGRFLYKSLILNNYNVQLNDFNITFKGKEVPHLTYPEYCQFTHYRPFKKFCIVRDPVDRFLSMIKDTWMLDEEQIDKMFKNQSNFDQMVNDICVNSNNNWFVPQNNFIDYKTKIWRFENKFNVEFTDWLSHNFDLKLNKLAVYYKQDYNKSNFPNNKLNKITLNNKQIRYIKDYYYKDYKILNY